jgi:hypothetical protein
MLNKLKCSMLKCAKKFILFTFVCSRKKPDKRACKIVYEYLSVQMLQITSILKSTSFYDLFLQHIKWRLLLIQHEWLKRTWVVKTAQTTWVSIDRLFITNEVNGQELLFILFINEVNGLFCEQNALSRSLGSM